MPLAVRSGSRSLDLAATSDGVRADGALLDARLTPLGGSSYLLVIGGRPRVVTVEPGDDPRARRVTLGGTTVAVDVRTDADLLMERFGLDAAQSSSGHDVKAPMPGLVLRVLVETGQTVEAGQGLVVLEAMKMENELAAPAAGVVTAVHAVAGAAVAKSALLVSLAPPEAPPGGAA